MMSAYAHQPQTRPPNWLPLPGVGAGDVHSIVVDENDDFSKGEVVKLYPNQGYGLIRTAFGKEAYFNLRELDLVGAKADRRYLKVGARVGYDLSWTSSGQHVTRLKIY